MAYLAKPYVGEVCVVICDEDIPEHWLRPLLSVTCPMRFVSWKSRSYRTVIQRLQPCTIVAAAPTPELALDSARLISCLFSRFEPTVISATISAQPDGDVQLAVEHLGPGATARITSLSDVSLAW